MTTSTKCWPNCPRRRSIGGRYCRMRATHIDEKDADDQDDDSAEMLRICKPELAQAAKVEVKVEPEAKPEIRAQVVRMRRENRRSPKPKLYPNRKPTSSSSPLKTTPLTMPTTALMTMRLRMNSDDEAGRRRSLMLRPLMGSRSLTASRAPTTRACPDDEEAASVGRVGRSRARFCT